MYKRQGLGATNVIDEEGHLLGLVTDGDVRRGLDSGSNFLEWPVEDMICLLYTSRCV